MTALNITHAIRLQIFVDCEETGHLQKPRWFYSDGCHGNAGKLIDGHCLEPQTTDKCRSRNYSVTDTNHTQLCKLTAMQPEQLKCYIYLK